MEKNTAPLCVHLSIILFIISVFNGAGVTFLILVLMRFRYKLEDFQDDQIRLQTEIQLTNKL